MDENKLKYKANLATLESFIQHPGFDLLYRGVIKELLVSYTKKCVSVNPERHTTIGTKHDVECLIVDVLSKVLYNIDGQLKQNKMKFQKDSTIQNHVELLRKQVDTIVSGLEVSAEDIVKED